MELRISNCGIVRDTTIKNKGITIITGKNGSGKTTIVKCLVSLLSSFEDYNSNLCDDIARHIKENITKKLNSFFRIRPYRFLTREGSLFNDKYVISNMPTVKALLSSSFSFDSKEDAVAFLHSLNDELYLNENNLEQLFGKYTSAYSRPRAKTDFQTLFNDLITTIRTTLRVLLLDSFDNDYLFESIRSSLNDVFSNQIIPLGKKTSPRIEIKFKNFNASYIHNNYVKTNFFDELDANPKAFYINDGNIIDSIDKKRNKKTSDTGIGLGRSSFYSLSDKLLYSLSDGKDFVKLLDNKIKFNKILSMIDEIWPHTVSKRGTDTINTDSGLKISNEASGAKIFIILKTLLLNGCIDANTILIFDEPENHLHPEWQGLFAKIVTSLSKDFGVNIVCVTHSSIMLLSFDVWTNILKFKDNFSCYFGEAKNGVSSFEDVTKAMNVAHDKLNEPYVLMDLQDDE